jgi:hypothetical protein
MGASVWQREGSGGKTFTTGIKPAEAQDRAPPASRKRVWTREAAVQVCALVPKRLHQAPPAFLASTTTTDSLG